MGGGAGRTSERAANGAGAANAAGVSRGVLVPTEREHQPSLITEFPALAPHPVLPKWLYLPEASLTFEADAARLIALIRRLDPRIGVIPGTKAKKPAKAKTGTTVSPKRKHFMLE